MVLHSLVIVSLLLGKTFAGTSIDSTVLDACPGYKATNIKIQGTTLTADLSLAAKACNVFGEDIPKLKLNVDYETKTRIHVKITDASKKRYEVPEDVFPRPGKRSLASPKSAAIQFNYTASPFSFSIVRTSTKEVLFSTASHPIIYEPQYLRLKTNLPKDANIYGLGEHTHSFRLDTHNLTRTIWNRDSFAVPTGTNLYGAHPVYFEHRTTGSHGVFLLNSNGMDVKLNDTEGAGTTLEYNVIGGILDFYFLAGSETDPKELARQYAEIVGKPAEVPYWGLGFHQCRFGYKDYVDLAGVISNYSAAGIPLETMWADIDYMDRRRVFTVDPDYFPMNRMQEIVNYLHSHNQQFITMVDPAVGRIPGYGPYDRGVEKDIWLKLPDGSQSLGLVWPGITVYPDWFHPRIQEYWTDEFRRFFDPTNGLDIDGSWIDMNEPANFCNMPCDNIEQQEREQNLPPPRSQPPPPPDVPIFVNTTNTRIVKRDNLLDPPYAINNAAGALSSKSAWTNSTSPNGLTQYDTHNLYGTLMSTYTHRALLARRPGRKTFVITRSTFAGAGKEVGKWLGDNFSTWRDYRLSISGILAFAGIFQIPVVGADICGFGGNTTETLCARWALLGSFSPFMRNHNGDTSNSQEFYRWPLVAAAAKHGIDIRYRLMDYLYTGLHTAHLDGTPLIQPIWYNYPDPEAYRIDTQFFFGPSVLVSPVTEDEATSVTFYLPKGRFYEFETLKPVQSGGAFTTRDNVNFTSIPIHFRGGSIVPLRVESAMTTAELRKKDFELIVALDERGQAEGSLYIDDGISTNSKSTTLSFKFAKNRLTVSGTFGYNPGVQLKRVRVLGYSTKPVARVNGEVKDTALDSANQVVDVEVGFGLDTGFSLDLA